MISFAPEASWPKCVDPLFIQCMCVHISCSNIKPLLLQQQTVSVRVAELAQSARSVAEL